MITIIQGGFTPSTYLLRMQKKIIKILRVPNYYASVLFFRKIQLEQPNYTTFKVVLIYWHPHSIARHYWPVQHPFNFREMHQCEDAASHTPDYHFLRLSCSHGSPALFFSARVPIHFDIPPNHGENFDQRQWKRVQITI